MFEREEILAKLGVLLAGDDEALRILHLLEKIFTKTEDGPSATELLLAAIVDRLDKIDQRLTTMDLRMSAIEKQLGI